ncbi:hypothetical protein E1281_21205 [Actinomadura sp. KC345]|uniref:hypothetical protein n=1 Tax=Actinomadura sp. KC345 TaxID=2530371 RepID=UPI00104EC2D8|nr:hypothetical protein [Actinomadura sp. KC345]TDC50999.1 hypothetical protein E1281_21205 [Actinomadura sp. KC345]
MNGTGHRGRSTAGYAGLTVLIGSVIAVVLASGVSVAFAKNCEGAHCRPTGADCAGNPPQAHTRGALETTAVSLGRTLPDPPADWSNFLPRPRIPKPTCNPDPNAKWAEGLHAHNDYHNRRPLLDALENGATSVEVDLFLDSDGQLYAKHDYEEAKGTQFKDVYIDGLMERAEKNGGQIYPGRDPAKLFQIIIELKEPNMQEGEIPPWVVDGRTKENYLHSKRVDAYWTAIRQTEELRTRYPNVQVVFSGGTPRHLAGTPDPLTWKVPQNVVYDISPGNGCTLPPEVDPQAPRLPSEPFDRTYAENFVILNGNWFECGDRDHDLKISDEEQRLLNDLVQRTHDIGLKVRLWDGPDGRLRSSPAQAGQFIPCHWPYPECDEAHKWAKWKAQQKAGVDYLNTNHLTNGREWIRYCGRKPV